MKICLGVSTFEGGGIGNAVSYEAKCLTSLGHEVEIVTLTKKREPPSNVGLIKLRKHNEVNRLQRDVLHLHDFLPLLRVLEGGDIVATYHGSVPWYQRPTIRDAILMPVYQRLYFRELRKPKVKKVIAVSEYVSKDLGDMKEKIVVIENGVDLEVFHPIDNERVKELKREMGEPALIYVGSFYKFKGVIALVKSMSSILKKYPKCKLTLVGYGPDQRTIIKLAKKLDVDDHVRIRGHILHEELPLYYNAADIFITASLYESFGLPLLEASACGIPVIGRNIPAITEQSKKSGSMLIFNEIREIPELISNALKNYPTLSRRALSYAQKLSWRGHVERLMEVYAMIERN